MKWPQHNSCYDVRIIWTYILNILYFNMKFCSHRIYHFGIQLLLLQLGFSETLGFFQSIGNAISYGIQSVGNFYCSGIQCCDFHLNDEADRLLLGHLWSKLYGQHIAQLLIFKAVASHLSHKPVKALGIGLHGWTGTGKNYVSQMIAESLYKKGMHSPLVHVFAGKASFPIAAEVNTYKKNLLGWIRGNVSQCGHSLFIFDECDKWPETLLDVVKPFLDYHPVIEGVDYRNAIFIFITNTGGSAIGELLLEFHEKGTVRDKLTFEDFHHAISLSLFNEEGGFYRSDIIRGDGIDFHIPFLPMEEKHVRMCALHHFKGKGYPKPTEEMIQKVLENMNYGPPSNPVFSMTGCKHVHALIVSALARKKIEL